MLTITDLHASINDTPILTGLTLDLPAGQVHAIMGPNGSGKSTLSKVIAGHPSYTVTKGSITFQGKDLLPLEPEERAQAGVFMSFQYPVEVPGVNNADFLRLAYNARQKARGDKELKAAEFAPLLDQKIREVQLDPALKDRQLNSGFSGGQKKRNEILQMVVLEPSLAILDETDSGLDIDALKVIANGVNALRSPDRSIVMVTHYQRLLNYIVPDRVHVLANGRIVKSGDKTLAHELERRGYGWIESEARA